MKSLYKWKVYFNALPTTTCYAAVLNYSSSSLRLNVKQKKKLLQDENKEKVAIISCKREELNHYKGQTYGKFAVVPLASQGWHHKKSKGDFFTINFGKVTAVPENVDTTFQEIGVLTGLIDQLKEEGICAPTHVQVHGIRSILRNKNTLLAAETGSGKTLAYLLPLLQQVLARHQMGSDRRMNSPLGLIITPSRDLAQQIGNVAGKLAACLGLTIEVVTGGGTKRMMLNPSFKDVDILIASLGALSKLTTTGIYRTDCVQHVVLDEADTLLDDSFSDKLVHFLKRFPIQFSSSASHQGVQITLVSATMPTSLPEILGDVVSIESLNKITTKHLHRVLPHVPQKFFRLGRSHKPGQLLKLINADVAREDPVIIFSNKSTTCDWLSMFLNENGLECVNLNGNINHRLREGKFQGFQSGYINILSCTDMGSRGLDTVRAKHVLNYDFPLYMADYIHRCGRIGRVGSVEGCHVTNFVAGIPEVELVRKIEMSVRTGEALPNVNGNITKIIKHKLLKSQ